MSADNWSICPRCRMDYDQKQAARELGLKAQYGKMPADKWIEQRRKFDELKSNSQLEETLREDYQIGTSDSGVFTVAYSCSCRCGFQFRFDHTQKTEAA